jgi:pimeloyl-ACP methyl ester carboxylesterase
MPSTVIDGIKTNYEIVGEGPPLLMFSPGGFDASLDKWRTLGVYKRIKPLDHLPKKYSCIIFDKRETGHSGGRVERIEWANYVAQGKGLLDHLNIEKAHIMGGCVGCSSVVAFAIAHPKVARSMVLYWPAGGAKYRINTHGRFSQHLAYVQEHGLSGVVELVKSTEDSFSKDPRGGPWVSVIRNDADFAKDYAARDVAEYQSMVAGMARHMFDRDSAPGAEPEDMMRLNIPTLIVPGNDPSHATSAACYLEECIEGSEYWDVPVDGQTEETAPARILEFLAKVEAGVTSTNP